MKLTNRQIEQAFEALRQFHPAVSLRVDLRLTRNLRRIESAWQEKEADRVALIHAVIKDKNRTQDSPNGFKLTVAEAEAFREEYDKLMKEEVEVDVQPLELVDGTETKIVPDMSIDRSKIEIPRVIQSALLDIVLIAKE